MLKFAKQLLMWISGLVLLISLGVSLFLLGYVSYVALQ